MQSLADRCCVTQGCKEPKNSSGSALRQWLSVATASHTRLLQPNTAILTSNNTKDGEISQMCSLQQTNNILVASKVPRVASQTYMFLHGHQQCHFPGLAKPQGQAVSVCCVWQNGRSVASGLSHYLLLWKGIFAFSSWAWEWNSKWWASGANSRVTLLSVTLGLLTVFFWELTGVSSPPTHSESFFLYIWKPPVPLT